MILLCTFAQAQLWEASDDDINNTNTGNVGIGTSSPAQLLELYRNNADVAIRFHDPGDQHYTMGMDYSDGRKFKIARGSDFSDTKLTITPAGDVGIGTTGPDNKAHIAQDLNWTTLSQGQLKISGTTDENQALWIGYDNTDNYGFIDVGDVGTAYQNLALCQGGGKVGIGTTTFASGYLLSVDGKVIAEEFKVQDSGSWPDHVFQAGYDLMPLPEVERYIAEHQHLPDVPSAEEVAADGLSLGKTQALLLQKIEELTLYMIDLKKENEALKARMNRLAK